jgi:WD40-like Beta Propeller Repeat
MQRVDDRHSAQDSDAPVRPPSPSRRGATARCSSARPAHKRVARERLALIALIALAVLAASSAPALALTQRGHEFGYEFSSKVEKAESEKGLAALGRLLNPAGAAVNEASGEVYIVDAGDQRIERFHPEAKEAEEEEPTGKPVAVWGFGVSNGENEFEICTENCHQGKAGTGEGQLDYPAKLVEHDRAAIAIAVDNSCALRKLSEPTCAKEDPSNGDVYVVSDTAAEPNAVQKFSATGTPMGKLSLPAGATVGGVSVDEKGIVWAQLSTSNENATVRLSLFERFSNEQPNKALAQPVQVHHRLLLVETEEVPEVSCPIAGSAVDGSGRTLYIDHERFGLGLNREELCFPEEEAENEAEAIEAKEEHIEGFKRKRATESSVAAKLSVVGEPPAEAQPLTFPTLELDRQETSAIAVDKTSAAPSGGSVYLDNEASVAAFDSSGSFIQRFTNKQLKADSGGAGLAIDGANQDVFVVDYKKDRVFVFEPEAPGAPTIDSVSYQDIEPNATELKAQIDPHGEEVEEYFFEYGTEPCTGKCPRTGSKKIPAGFGDVAVSERVGPLTPGTRYFFTVVAKNKHGLVFSESALNTFTTLPLALESLPDNRQWELVSPPQKGGATIEAIGGVGGNKAGPSVPYIEASEDGNAITYGAAGPTEASPEGNRAPEAQQVISIRHPEGWRSKDIATPSLFGEGVNVGTSEEYKLFNADLSLSVLIPWGLPGKHLQEPPLVPEVASEQRGIYERHNLEPACEATKSCYKPLFSSESLKLKVPVEFGGEVEFLGASSSLKQVVFRSTPALIESLTENTTKDLYEWNGEKPASEQLQVVNVLPRAEGKEGTISSSENGLGGTHGGVVSNNRHAISTDGHRVIWNEALPSHLYSRNMTTHQTLQVDKAEAGVKLPEGFLGTPVFQDASEDGKRIFFTDTAPLTKSSTLQQKETHELAGADPSDLYVCEVEENEAGEPKCNLTDLTTGTRAEFGEDADLTQDMPGVNKDGTYAYFVANGALAPGAVKGNCETPFNVEEVPLDATCNLYVEHYNSEEKKWERPKVIAVLSRTDRPDWSGDEAGRIDHLSSRVSPNGQWFAFMSNRSLTGKSNKDAVSAALDEEVYLYHAESGQTPETLVCASCNPTKAAPHGVLDVGAKAGEAHGEEGLGLLADRPSAWFGQTLAGSVPTWTYTSEQETFYQSRYLSDEGRLFFNSPDQLVPMPEKEGVREKYDFKENVYEYQPPGLPNGTCAKLEGCVALISSGTSSRESAFIDASADGSNVFFITYAQLVAADRDQSLDVYDARICTEGSPCLKSAAASGRGCETTETCRPPPPEAATFEVTGPSGTGNVPKTIVRPAPKEGGGGSHKPTKLQIYKAELKKCHKIKHHRKRVACERRAKARLHAKTSRRHAAASRRRGRR